MEDREFLHHLHLIRDILKNSSVRLVLLHNPYTQEQQVFVDKLCMRSKQIIGQVERQNPIQKAAKQIQLLIDSHHEPLIKKKQIRFVILGQQKPESAFNVH